MKHDGLALLESRVASDLARTAHPRAPWLEPKLGPDGRHAFDVIIVGGGQSGLAIAFGLMRSQVTNILILDRAAAGQEGPWRSYARMQTLRSPKDFTGPDLDIPSLTYQSWHEARYGQESWDQLAMIARDDWAAYLDWFGHVTKLPVRNGAEVTEIAPAGALLTVKVRSQASDAVLHTRKVVLATGQEGTGRWTIPPPFSALPRACCVQAAEEIDFAALKSRRIAIIGAGASAFDNAATALEAGAHSVDLLCRRSAPQVIQPYRWLTFRGFLRHLGDLDDAWRWRFMQKILAMREGFPQTTYDRCAMHPNFRLHTGASVRAVKEISGSVTVDLPETTIDVDFVIVAAGIEIDLAARPELSRFAGNIASWGDRYTPPKNEQDDRLAAFPYLADSYAFTEKQLGLTPYLRNIHLFSSASTMSFGASGSSINAMTTAVPKLVHGVTRDLFQDDVERHWRDLQAYKVPQAIVHAKPPFA